MFVAWVAANLLYCILCVKMLETETISENFLGTLKYFKWILFIYSKVFCQFYLSLNNCAASWLAAHANVCSLGCSEPPVLIMCENAKNRNHVWKSSWDIKISPVTLFHLHYSVCSVNIEMHYRLLAVVSELIGSWVQLCNISSLWFSGATDVHFFSEKNVKSCVCCVEIPRSDKVTDGPVSSNFVFVPDMWLVLLCAGGAHAGECSPQPHDEPHSPTHSASPGCSQRTPQHRPDPARGRHGRQLCGEGE